MRHLSRLNGETGTKGCNMNSTNHSKTRSRVMAPNNNRWDEFIEILGGPTGCNFHKNASGHITWNCDASRNRPIARNILEEMGMDVEQSLLYFEEHGGYCDCEILFNVLP